MSGHNKWSQIKEKKGAVDAQRSKLFGKLAKLIKTESRLSHGDLNAPSLRAAIEKARAANMPKDNIDRALASAENTAEEKVTYEAYGPGGAALIIEGLTDSTNRTSQEMKHLLSQHGLSLAAPGSALWAFSKNQDGVWEPTTTVPLSPADGEKLGALLSELEEHDDVQEVYTNAAAV
jgi:YebC/PmpR family DNA-binding regulatory protein